MAKTVVCTGRAFKGLVDRYTGRPMKVMMIVAPGRIPRFYAPDAYDPTRDDFPTAKAAHEAWSRKDGVAGLRTGAPVCAYTGERLHPVETPYGHRFRGGFSPKTPQPRERFLALARGRKPALETHVEPPQEEAPAPLAHAPDLDAHVEEAVRTLVDEPPRRRRR